MKPKSSKTVTDLHRLLDAQKFKTLEDLNKFMEGMIGMTIPETPQEELTVQQRADDMVFEAFDLPPDKARQQARRSAETRSGLYLCL